MCLFNPPIFSWIYIHTCKSDDGGNWRDGWNTVSEFKQEGEEDQGEEQVSIVEVWRIARLYEG